MKFCHLRVYRDCIALSWGTCRLVRRSAREIFAAVGRARKAPTNAESGRRDLAEAAVERLEKNALILMSG